MCEGLGPVQESQKVIELGSASKRRKVQIEENDLSREKRNEVLKSQKVLFGRVSNLRIFDQLGMVEFFEFVRHKDRMHISEILIPSVFKKGSLGLLLYHQGC